MCKVSFGELELVIKLQGLLEDAAVAALALNGVHEATRVVLVRSIGMTRGMVPIRRTGMDDVAAIQDASTLFHETVICDFGNEHITLSCQPVRHMRMVALGSYAPNPDLLGKELRRMSDCHVQHAIVAKAANGGDAASAETVMREHSSAIECSRLFVGPREANLIPTLFQAVCDHKPDET